MRLKELRIENNLTQWEVAKGIGTGQSNIGRWEREEVLPTSDFILKLADFFQVSTDYLLGHSDDFKVGAAAPMGEVSGFTKEEKQLIEKYRELNAPGKKLVKTVIDTHLATMSENKKIN